MLTKPAMFDCPLRHSTAMPSIGPSIPAHLLQKTSTNDNDDNGESSDDDYGPSLPPDIVDQKKSEPKRIVGPSFPDRPPPEDDSDDDIGPIPLPKNVVIEEESGVDAFLAKEERRRKAIEVCKIQGRRLPRPHTNTQGRKQAKGVKA